MSLGVGYAGQDCSLARALEVVGERWTMLILRDCFFGVRRFTDLQQHLDISKAVLTDRLTGLVEAGLLLRIPRGRRDEYELTDKGLDIWPALQALTHWGDVHESPTGARRVFSHATCGSDLDSSCLCPTCGVTPPPAEIAVRRGPGVASTPPANPISVKLREPRRLLEPLRG
jgi:DNA-binding HxlR family transcriptional regulator